IADRRNQEILIFGIEPGNAEVQRQRIEHRSYRFELDADSALLAGIEQREARTGEDVRLKAFDLLIEHREVRGNVAPVALHSQLDDARFLGASEAAPRNQVVDPQSGVDERLTIRDAGTAVARKVDRAGLEAGCVA